MNMNRYQMFLARKDAEYGIEFDDSNLASKFVPYFNSGKRIKVLTSDGRTLYGTVGVTTGWKPVFLLMRNSNRVGSSDLLSDSDRIVAVQGTYTKKYVSC